MKVLKKLSFDPTAQTEPQELGRRVYAPGEFDAMVPPHVDVRQFDMLPEEYRALCDPNEGLPLEYLDPSWIGWLVVAVNPVTCEPHRGNWIHKNWELPSHKRFWEFTFSTVPYDGYLRILCPDGTYLLLKVTMADYLPPIVKVVEPPKKKLGQR